jgi:ubiquinone/menaquinone biosynthesis C-methylase UbiE
MSDLVTYLNKKKGLVNKIFIFMKSKFRKNKYRYHIKSITGINIVNHQIEKAQKRVIKSELQNKIKFEFGSATNISSIYGENAFTKIIALESAFHFDTRELFFQESYKSLKPNGILCTADLAILREGIFKN